MPTAAAAALASVHQIAATAAALATTAPARAQPVPANSANVWRVYQGGVGAADAATDEKALVEHYLPLVRNVVDRIKLNLPAHVDVEDLYSVGATGLIAAVKKYDPAQSATFAGYATMRIRGAVLDELRRLDWCPRRARAKAKKIKEAMNTVEQRTGRPAGEQEVRAELGLSEKDYAHWLDESKPATFVPLDQHADGEEGEGASLHELVADQNEGDVRDALEHEELVQLMLKRIASLPDTPRKILSLYYHEGLRLAEIAEVFGLTESRICQIHSQTILQLRASLQRERNR
jgi:RNA polymerase sigma factor FliA